MLPKARIGSKGHFPVLADYLTIRSIIEQTSTSGSVGLDIREGDTYFYFQMVGHNPSKTANISDLYSVKRSISHALNTRVKTIQ